MMMNRIGKGLVLVHTAASIVALAWAMGLFFQFTDWGWKEPRSELGLRVASEYDKRTAAFKDAARAVSLSVPGLQPARLSLRAAEERFPRNHLYYNQELARLRSAADPIEVMYIKKTGPIALDAKAIGRPVLEGKVEGIAKSYDSYRADLKRIREDIDKEEKELRDWTAKIRTITITLSGKDDTGKEVKNTLGIYSLLDAEKKAQDQAYFEKAYLRPIWAGTLQEAELFAERRAGLQETLDRLQGKKK
jgi:hypothetical protein